MWRDEISLVSRHEEDIRSSLTMKVKNRAFSAVGWRFLILLGITDLDRGSVVQPYFRRHNPAGYVSEVL